MRSTPNHRNFQRKLARLAAAFLAFAWFPCAALAVDLVPTGASWLYLDDGSDQGTAWRAPDFPDGGWGPPGNAQLGYGDADESTLVNGGPAGSRYATTYFRTHFTVVDPNAIEGLDLGVLRDDGAIVYLNGTEVYRANMPGGTVSYDTFASSTVGGTEEDTFYYTPVVPSLLVPGDNVLAVEIHQTSPTSSDISFRWSRMQVRTSSSPVFRRSSSGMALSSIGDRDIATAPSSCR